MSGAKRAMDLTLALAGLALLAPVLAAIAVLVRLCDGSPVLFRQVRVGENGPFALLKFRTMRSTSGPLVTSRTDRRITRLGAFLRRWKLDELPQLVNVIRGEMTLVGPRPEVPEFVATYTATQRRVLAYRPGLTDPAALAFRDEATLLAGAAEPVEFYRTVVLPAKLELSLSYAQHATFMSDLSLLMATARAVFRPASRSVGTLPCRLPVSPEEITDVASS